MLQIWWLISAIVALARSRDKANAPTRQRDKSHTPTRKYCSVGALLLSRCALSPCRLVAFSSPYYTYIDCLFENRFEPKGYLFFTYNRLFYLWHFFLALVNYLWHYSIFRLSLFLKISISWVKISGFLTTFYW